MTHSKEYHFTIYQSIEGLSKYDSSALENVKNPFENIEGSFVGIDYSCKWNPKTSWYTDCKPAFFVSGKLKVNSLDEIMKKLPEVVKGLQFDRVQLERRTRNSHNFEVVEAEFEYANGELSYGKLGQGRVISSNHPFYQKFHNMIKMMKGVTK